MGTSSNVILGPGLLYVAPVGTTEPTNASTVLPSANWREVGYTEDGTTFTYEITNEPIEVEEEFDPIFYRTTGRSGTVAFQMAEVTRQNLALAVNVGAAAPNNAASLEPPSPNSEVRVMIALNTDDGARWIWRQCLQASSIEIARKKAPDKALLPVEFRLEKPTGLQPWIVFPNATFLV